ncbi:alpha/beta fold hydrolase [Chitinophaga sp. Mgbs1]|uniref:Alpha/beta fold hydrolase n=1 Tax=Chitinophaga solisilvae TaxID=1233460 RepID=A0A3S1DMI8_9BACT|nr:alpha/beta fold hydrolase [Chitinophaga solisilvae]
MKCFFLFVCSLFSFMTVTARQTPLQRCHSFFPDRKELQDDAIDYYLFTVPENYGQADTRQIQLAVMVLHSWSQTPLKDPVLFIQGGPGAAASADIGFWQDHPFRENRDIILVDLRGTGCSVPALCTGEGARMIALLAADSRDTTTAGKTRVVQGCMAQMKKDSVDLSTYSSRAVARDLHALKAAMGYPQWNIYGVSYGTHIAMTYLEMFPTDVRATVLDAPVAPMSGYYNHLTGNFARSLRLFFDHLRNDKTAAVNYPGLETLFYQTLHDLEKQPLEVAADKSILSSGKFILNADDMALIVQQCLYDQQLTQVLPLMITAFHDRNKPMTEALVKAFSNRLSMAYGAFYCMLYNDMLCHNSLEGYRQDAARYPDLPLHYFESDMQAAKNWPVNPRQEAFAAGVSLAQQQVLLLTGEMDPLIAPADAAQLTTVFPHGFLITLPGAGHKAGYSEEGIGLAQQFMNRPEQHPDTSGLAQKGQIRFVAGVKVSGGTGRLAADLMQLRLPVLIPLALAYVWLLLMLISVIIRSCRMPVKFLPWNLLLCTAMIMAFLLPWGLYTAIRQTAGINPYILAVGLPGAYSWTITLCHVLTALTGVLLLVFLFIFTRLPYRRLYTSSMLALVAVMAAYLYWGL